MVFKITLTPTGIKFRIMKEEEKCEHEDTFADGLTLYCNKCGEKLEDLEKPIFY